MFSSFFFLLLIVLTAPARVTSAAPEGVVDLSQDWEEAPLYNKNRAYCNIRASMHIGIHGFSVFKDGKIIAEAYNHFHDASEIADTYSQTKAWGSMVIGYLVGQNLVGLNTTLGEMFNETQDWEGVSDAESKKQVTVFQLLTMTSGLSENFWNYITLAKSFLGSFLGIKSTLTFQDTMNGLNYDPNAVGKNIYLPTSAIVGQVILRVAGKGPSQVAKDAGIFDALGMEENKDYFWTAYGGIESTALGMQLRPRSMAKLGVLYLQKGYANDSVAPLIDSDWIKMSTMNQLPLGTRSIWFPTYGYGFDFETDYVDSGNNSIVPEMEGVWRGGGSNSNFGFAVPKQNVFFTLSGNLIGDVTGMIGFGFFPDIIFRNIQYLEEEVDECPKSSLPTKIRETFAARSYRELWDQQTQAELFEANNGTIKK